MSNIQVAGEQSAEFALLGAVKVHCHRNLTQTCLTTVLLRQKDDEAACRHASMHSSATSRSSTRGLDIIDLMADILSTCSGHGFKSVSNVQQSNIAVSRVSTC